MDGMVYSYIFVIEVTKWHKCNR